MKLREPQAMEKSWKVRAVFNVMMLNMFCDASLNNPEPGHVRMPRFAANRRINIRYHEVVAVL